MRLHWTGKARRDIREIHRRRANYSAASARRLVAGIRTRALVLREYPDIGRMVPEFELREVRELIEGDFRIVYERFPDPVEIIAVLPGRMSFADWTL